MTTKAAVKYTPAIPQKKYRRSLKRDRFIKEIIANPDNATAAARRAGYGLKQTPTAANRLMHDSYVLDKIKNLGIIGLDTLEDVAVNGTNELARVNAGKTLVETAYGKPKDGNTINAGDITINIAKLV